VLSNVYCFPVADYCMQRVPYAEVAAYQYTQTSDRSAAIWSVSPCMGLLGALNWHATIVFFSRRVPLVFSRYGTQFIKRMDALFMCD
jgi:hypothetical protein